MLENCPVNDCPYQGEHGQKITSLEKRVFKLEEDQEIHRGEIHRMDRDGAVMENRFNNIIVTLAKIETTLDTMQKAIEELKMKPAESWKWIVGIAGGGVPMALVNYIMAVVLKG